MIPECWLAIYDQENKGKENKRKTMININRLVRTVEKNGTPGSLIRKVVNREECRFMVAKIQ